MIVEVCAASLRDCLIAEKCGADRIELNTALYLGGLTASATVLQIAKSNIMLPIMCMVRPRPAGFFYDDIEKIVMLEEARLLLNNGADGIVFGCLNKHKQIDIPFAKEMIALVKSYNKEVVFHRAFDIVKNINEATEHLIELGVNRILTSGTQATAWAGREQLKHLQQHYGKEIDFCMGAGINAENINPLIKATGIQQCHASFKGWYIDETTSGNQIDYRYGEPNAYEQVDIDMLEAFMKIIDGGINDIGQWNAQH